jgi:hypothetical protein
MMKGPSRTEGVFYLRLEREQLVYLVEVARPLQGGGRGIVITAKPGHFPATGR